MTLIDLEQGSPEWLEWRKGRVCASEIAAIMDCCPYQTGYELWERKTGRAAATKAHRGMALGHAAEVEVRAWLNEHTKREYRPVCVESDSDPRFAASLDAWCEDGIAEIKLVNAQIAADLARGEPIPRHHWLQMQWQMYVTGFKSCLYVYRNADLTTVRNVVADEAIQAVMGREALKFLSCVENDAAWEKTERDVYELQAGEDLEYEYLCALEILDDQKQVVEALKHKLASTMRHRTERGTRLKLSTVERRGAVDYDAMLKYLAERHGIDESDLDTEAWRKPGSEYLKITELK